MEPEIIVVDENLSLTPYIKLAKNTADVEGHLESLGLEVYKDPPRHKIGFIEAMARALEGH